MYRDRKESRADVAIGLLMYMFQRGGKKILNGETHGSLAKHLEVSREAVEEVLAPIENATCDAGWDE